MDSLTGSAEGTLFRNEENGYSVISLRTREGLITVTGTMPLLMDGETVELDGAWVDHPQYGKQFKVSQLRIHQPQTLSAIEKYLGSGLIKGVGPSTARLIVAAFGKETLEVLGTQPERLLEVPKIGKIRMKQIAQSFLEQQASRSTFIFLQQYGISPALSAKIHKVYRDNTETLIRDNPYRLIDDIQGVGFLTADRIALSLGISEDSPFRLQAGIKYALQEASLSGGHTCLMEQELIDKAAELLYAPGAEIRRLLDELTLQKHLQVDLVDEVRWVSLPSLRKAEIDIAGRLLNLCKVSQQFMPGHVKANIKDFEKEQGIEFSKTQRAAVQKAAEHGLLVITGGPGTGKTTLINCIIHVLGSASNILLAAPTGRAAKRMSEACGREASTIHRLLQYGGEEGSFQINQENPLDCDCLIVDEVSMMDVFLMKSLLLALQPGTRLILVGDADQLPSVGPGNVLSDLLSCPAIPNSRLHEIFRQGQDSMIVVNAHRINQGQDPLMNTAGSDFFFENKGDPNQVVDTIMQLCLHRLPKFLKVKDGMRHIQVLSPTRKGMCGVQVLNTRLQEAFNPPTPRKKEVQFGEMTLREGDKVMHIRNNYQLEWETRDGGSGQGVFNGDIGLITSIQEDDKLVSVLYDDDKTVQYTYGDLEELDLAYCLSVHKSQGSEFPAVIMPMVGGPRMLLTRNLLYTGVTRARRLVVLVGRQEVLNMMVNNNLERRRYSLLSHWLNLFAPEFA
ncbi:MAG: ATP-dependent RecD-like DNA helicase [Clostridiales bacterium]|jgi:exodeoxyribonuclease V alpha subunit|nr:ATP-dependent RecD-like DNA helicase [Clostridiales bacterium]